MSHTCWYHFWNPDSGAIGGLIFGCVVFLVWRLAVRYITRK